jgi:flavin-dependent dehydrogenase
MALASPLHHRRPTWDVIVVGARCAGSPTAMLLARAGFRVLLVDRAHFPSDSMRCHYIQRPGVEYLSRWGLLPRIEATGTPRIESATVDLGDFPLTLTPEKAPEFPGNYAPRRFVLDAILVEAAAEAGVSVRQGCSVHDLIWEDGRVAGVRGRMAGGLEVVERAHLVVGADGIYSRVARAVDAPAYNEHPVATCCYYSYFEDVPVGGIEISFRDDRFVVAFPTNAGLTGVGVALPIGEFPRFRNDIEGTFMAALEKTPTIAARVAAGRRAERWLGTADLPGYFRRSHGPGWALVGDAGHHKDPIPARGISDAFHSAALLAEAIETGFSGQMALEPALAEYERRRNESAAPGYEEANARAAFAPFPAEVYAMRAALQASAA